MKSSSQRQKVEWWGQEVRGRDTGGVRFVGLVSATQNEKVLKICLYDLLLCLLAVIASYIYTHFPCSLPGTNPAYIYNLHVLRVNHHTTHLEIG